MTTNLVARQADELSIQPSCIEPRAVMAQFFKAELENKRTRRAYKSAAAAFFLFIVSCLICLFFSLSIGMARGLFLASGSH